MKNSRAFTLIELLVVIAIIAILAAILFPVFAQAKVAAKKSSDLSSVKQTNLAHIMYAGDADDTAVGQNNDVDGFPNPWNVGATFTYPQTLPATPHPLGYMDPAWPGSWAREIQPYMKSLDILVSIAAPKDPNADWGYSKVAGAGNASWMMNGAMQQLSMTSVSAPAELVVFQSALQTTREARTQPARLVQKIIINGIDLIDAGSTFGKGANYGWLDGHANFKLRPQITYRNMGVSGTVHRINKDDSESLLPNTTGLVDPTLPGVPRFETWGDANLSSL